MFHKALLPALLKVCQLADLKLKNELEQNPNPNQTQTPQTDDIQGPLKSGWAQASFSVTPSYMGILIVLAALFRF